MDSVAACERCELRPTESGSYFCELCAHPFRNTLMDIAIGQLISQVEAPPPFAVVGTKYIKLKGAAFGQGYERFVYEALGEVMHLPPEHYALLLRWARGEMQAEDVPPHLVPDWPWAVDRASTDPHPPVLRLWQQRALYRGGPLCVELLWRPGIGYDELAIKGMDAKTKPDDIKAAWRGRDIIGFMRRHGAPPGPRPLTPKQRSRLNAIRRLMAAEPDIRTREVARRLAIADSTVRWLLERGTAEDGAQE